MPLRVCTVASLSDGMGARASLATMGELRVRVALQRIVVIQEWRKPQAAD
jgi:hypothetical protein